MSSVGTKLDGNQVLKQSYDDASNRIRVDAAISATLGEVVIKDPQGDHLNVNPDGSINTNIVSPLAIEIDAADGDNIAISDGVDTMAVNNDGSINVNVLNSASSGILPGGLQGNLTLTTANTPYEVKVGASALSNRSVITILPMDADMYWGYDNTVSTSTGTPLYRHQFIEFDLNKSSNAKIYLVCANASRNARVTETL